MFKCEMELRYKFHKVIVHKNTHVSGEEEVHLFLDFALTLRMDGQQVASEAQCVAACLITSHQEDECLTHDLLLGYGLPLRTQGGRLLLVDALVLIGG